MNRNDACAVVRLPGALANGMTASQYEAERARLREAYGDDKTHAGARFEQELAKLFYRSGWTQEQLAEREGTSQQSIDRRLRFGRFLEFSQDTPGGSKPQNPAVSRLTERRFRQYWSRTDKTQGNERARFAAVLRLIEADTTLRRPQAKAVRPRLLAEFADGKWHPLATITARLDEPEEVVKKSLDILVYGQSQKTKCERKQVGTSWSYRLFPIRQDRAVSSLELAEKLGPIIEGLVAEGKKSMATASPGTVAKLAHDLKTLIDQWVK